MTKQKKVAAGVLLLGIWLLNGCAALVVGAGAGAGTYTYIQGDLNRSYEVKFDSALKICIGILEDLDQPIIEKSSDGGKTTLKSKPWILWGSMAVRTGRVGYWKREVSQQFHDFIEERLKK